MVGPRNQRKTKEIVKTIKDHGPHRRNDKSECQECTCKIDKSLSRRMCIKFESRKNCVAGNHCDNSDFDFCNAEHKELKPKGTQASLGTSVIAVTILLILSILFSGVTINVLVFVLRVVYCDAVHVRCSASGFCIISKFILC